MSEAKTKSPSAARKGRRALPATRAPNIGGLGLQQVAGNAAVAELIEGAQAKLTVGATDDPLEREADAVADRVVLAIRTGAVAARDTSALVRRQLQRRAATPAGSAGGEAGSALERSLGAARSGGEPLPATRRETLEPAFGADFSRVRVHTGPDAAQLNDAVGADAFTVGSDIFFRDGLPDARDPLLAHELTHVVQQGADADTAQRRPVIRRRGTGKPLAAIQAFKRGRGGVVDDSGAAVDIPAGTQLTVNDEQDKRRRGKDDDPLGEAGYVQIRHSEGPGSDPDEFRRLWVRADALDLGPAGDEGTAVVDEVLEDIGYAPTLFAGYKGFSGKKVTEALEVDKAGTDTLSNIADVGDIAGTFITFAACIRKFSRDDVKGADKAEAALEMGSAGYGGAKAISNIVKTANDAKAGSDESVVTGALGGFGEIFNGLKETYKAVRKIVELVMSANDKAKAKTGQEVFKDIMATVASMLKTAQEGVKAAKSFVEMYATPSQPLADAIPGFGIAISAADLIVRSVDLVSAQVQVHAMRKEKHGFKEAIGGKKGVSSKKDAQQIIADLDAKRERGEDLTDEEQAKYEAANDYLFAKGLQWINDKRRNRAILKMSVALAKGSGDVAMLGGASAPVGAGLKAGAMALDVGASIFRKIKQWGRNTKARKEGKGKEVTGFFSVFNADKSTAKKEVGYHKMVDKIFDMILTADARQKPDPDTRFDKVKKYLAAIGMHIDKLMALRDNPGKLRGEMIAALKKRE